MGVDFCKTAFLVLLRVSTSSGGGAFIRPDLRRPSTTKLVGPSASIFFHGGEGGRDDLAESSSLRLLDGRPEGALPVSLLKLSSAAPFLMVEQARVGWGVVSSESDASWAVSFRSSRAGLFCMSTSGGPTGVAAVLLCTCGTAPVTRRAS